MVQMDEDRWTCKLIDFGISAFMDTEGYTKLTKTGEQVAGGNFIDPLLSIDPSLRDVRSDIYSTGAIFYYLLCGRPPVGADARDYLLRSNNKINKKQANVIMKALASDIEDRYINCNEMIDAINTVINEHT